MKTTTDKYITSLEECIELHKQKHTLLEKLAESNRKELLYATKEVEFLREKLMLKSMQPKEEQPKLKWYQYLNFKEWKI